MSRKPHSFRPSVEALEERSLMCNVFVGPGGVLNIIGDPGADTIHVYDDGNNTITGDACGVNFTATGINSIVIDSGAGDDVVTYNLTGDLQSNVTRSVSVALRDGNDRFFASLYNPTTQQYSDFRHGSLLLMGVNGHEGNDDMFFDASGGVNMDHATMKIAFHGNDGDDRIGMSYAGINDHGGVTFWTYAGAGDDHVRMSMWADPSSVAPHPGGFRGIAYGEDGNDEIFLWVDAPKDVSQYQTLIDGGDGKDLGWGNIDPNNIINCEL